MLQKSTAIAVLTLGVLLATSCGGQPAPAEVTAPAQAPPTRVAVSTQPPPAVITVPPAVASRSPAMPTATRPGPTSTLLGPTASAVSAVVATGLTDDGHHFWGAPDAPVTMIDFSDFM